MTTPIETTVHQWLSLMGIRIEKKYVGERLMSHPDYPSALSITSFLDDLGIENGVTQIEPARLHEMPAPFLAFVDQKDFVIVQNSQTINRTVEDFEKRWHGVVVLAEKPAVISSVLKTAMDSARHVRIKQAISIVVGLLLFAAAAFQLPPLSSILLLISLAGLVVSSSVVMRELGIETVVSQHLCGKGGNTGCDAILKSNASTLPFNVKLSDAGVSFFSGIIFLMIISSLAAIDFQNEIQLVIAGLCFSTLPFTMFSVYYQWKVAKQWCTSCLLLVAALVVLIILQTNTEHEWTTLTVPGFITAISIFIIPGITWLLIRPLIEREKELVKSSAVSKQFYLSPQLLEAHLKKQPSVDVRPWEEDFRLGNADAPLQVLVVSSYFCGPCAETHEILKTLLARHEHIGVTVRFLSEGAEQEEMKTKVLRYMLQYALSNQSFLDDGMLVEEMIATWYKLMDVEEFKKHYPLAEFLNVEALLIKQKEWSEIAAIEYTPTIFINGYRLEKPFTQADLPILCNSLSEIFSTVEDESAVLT